MKWHRRFLSLAEHIAGWSKDPSTKCGSVIVNDTRQVLGLGYNGFPRGVFDHDVRYVDRAQKYKYVVHAEANAILNADDAVTGATIYTTKYPCSECTKLIIQAGLQCIVAPAPTSSESDQRWSEDREFSRIMLSEAGVKEILL